MLTFFYSKEKRRWKALLGFFPSNISVYHEAVTHKSISLHDSYQRLEFLGDAVLDAVVAAHLFGQFPDKEEGFLTQTKSKIVNRSQLNQIARRLELDKLIKIDPQKVGGEFSSYGDVLEAIIGAVFLDQGFGKTKQFILSKVLVYMDVKQVASFERDFKSRVYEWAQKEKVEVQFLHQFSDQLYEAVLYINGKEISRGRAKSKKMAEQYASKVFYDRDLLI